MKNIITVITATLIILNFTGCSNNEKKSHVIQADYYPIAKIPDIGQNCAPNPQEGINIIHNDYYPDRQQMIQVSTLTMSRKRFNRLANFIEKQGIPSFAERKYRFWTEHDYVLRDSLNNIHHFFTIKNSKSKIIYFLVDVFKNDDNDPNNFFAQYYVDPTGISYFQNRYAGRMDSSIVHSSYKLFLAQANKKI